MTKPTEFLFALLSGQQYKRIYGSGLAVLSYSYPVEQTIEKTSVAVALDNISLYEVAIYVIAPDEEETTGVAITLDSIALLPTTMYIEAPNEETTVVSIALDNISFNEVVIRTTEQTIEETSVVSVVLDSIEFKYVTIKILADIEETTVVSITLDSIALELAP